MSKNTSPGHICFVSNSTWNIFNFRGNLVREFISKGFKVTVIAPQDQCSDKLKAIGCVTVPLNMNSQGTNPIKELVTVAQLIKIYKKTNPTVILHYTPKLNIYGTFAAVAASIPVINNISGLGSAIIKNNFLSFLVKTLYRLSQRFAARVFFQNGDDMELFLRSGLVKAGNIDLLPGSGIDLNRFLPVNKTKHKNGTVCFLLIARLLWDKGVGEYVDAAEILRPKYNHIKFQIIGFLGVNNPTAISKEQLEKWEQEGLIEYLGSAEDVRPYIAEADCVVLPSYREGTPRSLLEAAAMEKPIITTNAVGCREVVDDGVNGFLCKLRSVDDLVTQIEKIIHLTEQEKKKMGQAGRMKMLAEFDEKIVIQKYLDVIESIGKGRVSPRLNITGKTS